MIIMIILNIQALEEEEEQLAAEYENEKKPEEDKDYDEWLTKTYNTINDKITVLQQERRINKEDNHAQLSRKNKKLVQVDRINEMNEQNVEYGK